MRILFLSENFPPETNAAAARVFERASYWVGWGHEVRVITGAPNFPDGELFGGFRNAWYERSEMDGVEVVRVKTFIAANRGVVRRGLDFASFMVSGFAAGLFERAPDVVVATSPQLLTAVSGCALAAARGLPFVFELSDLWPASIRAVHGLRGESLLRALERLELSLYRRSAAVVALTESFKRNLVERGIPAEKVEVVQNGADLRRFSPRPRDLALAAQWNLAGKFVVGYLGTHGVSQRLDRLLDAARLLRDRPEVRFLLVGSGAERPALLERLRAERIDNVVMLARQPREAMPSYLSLCDLALAHLRDDPVFSGAIPSKMFEAMAMGLPILLAAPPGEASRIVEQSGAGVHVPAEKPEALAAAVRALCDDRARLRTLAQKSRESATLHTRERQAREMERVLLAVAAAPLGAQM